MLKCKRCGKSISSRKISGYCRPCYHYAKNKELIQKRRESKLCIGCGIKIKPKIIYYRKCDGCIEKEKQPKILSSLIF